MAGKVLLVEPVAELADVLHLLLEDMDYVPVLVPADEVMTIPLSKGSYACSLINLDQNRPEWSRNGLAIADRIAQVGVPVVMIADRTEDAKILAGRPWVYIEKPFSIRMLKLAIKRAISSATAAPEE